MSDTDPSLPTLPDGLAAALDEQRTSWRDGRPVLVEDLLRRNPGWAANSGAVLELVYNEAILRQQQGLAVDLPALQRRFPDVASQLEVQWRVDQAVLTPLVPTTASSGLSPEGPMPTHVGRYRVERLLGAGGMGVVYQAWDPDLGRPLAVKMLKGGPPAGDAVARFRTEAAAIAQVQHPNLVPVYDVGECDGRPYIAMEFCTGGTLADRLRAGPLTAAAAAAAVTQVARGVAAAHDRHVLHRDLKPSNVLLAGGPEPAYKVADFGLAKDMTREDGVTESGAVLGTPNYMPPEQAFGPLKNLQPTADVYAVGAILYECLTGRPPFQGATVADTLSQVRDQEPVPVRRLQPSAPRDLETICLKCLRKDPAHRYPTAAALADDLARFQAGRPILARPAGPVERGWRWARRNRLAASLAAAVVLLAAAAAVGGTVLSVWLAAALDAARRDRDVANDAVRETREHLAAAHAAAARLALQRGNGRAALQRLDEAAAAGLDTPAMRLDRVKALCAIHDLARAVDEVRLLAQRDDLGPLAGEVLLWRADLEIDAHTQTLEDGVPQFRRAVELGLSDADQHYARGLLAGTGAEALDHFRRAVQADPANPRTNAMLATLLTLFGRFDEARERLAAAELLFPENPVFVLIHAIADAFTGRPEAVRRGLAALRARVGEQQYAMMAAAVYFCEDLTAFAGGLERIQCGDPTANRFVIGIQFAGTLQKAQAVASKGGQDLFLPFPPGLLQALRATAGAVSTDVTGARSGPQPGLAAAFKRLGDVLPDGTYLLFAATQRAQGGTAADWEAARVLFEQAATRPSVLPVHRMCLYGTAVAEATLFRDGPESERADHRRRALEAISQLVDGGVIGQQGFKVAAQCDALDAPPELTWRALAAWAKAAPDDRRLPLGRAKAFLRTGAFEAAGRLADDALKDRDDADWRDVRKQADEGRRRLAKDVAATPPKAGK